MSGTYFSPRYFNRGTFAPRYFSGTLIASFSYVASGSLYFKSVIVSFAYVASGSLGLSDGAAIASDVATGFLGISGRASVTFSIYCPPPTLGIRPLRYRIGEVVYGVNRRVYVVVGITSYLGINSYKLKSGTQIVNVPESEILAVRVLKQDASDCVKYGCCTLAKAGVEIVDPNAPGGVRVIPAAVQYNHKEGHGDNTHHRLVQMEMLISKCNSMIMQLHDPGAIAIATQMKNNAEMALLRLQSIKPDC